mgnify:FL=1
MKNKPIQKTLQLVFENPKIFKFFQERLLPREYTKFKKHLVQKYADFNHTIIDFACGVGNISEAIPSSSNSYIGVDINEKSIVAAKKLYPQRQFILTKIGELHFKD